MNLARLDTWIARMVREVDTGMGRSRQRQLPFSILYSKYQPRTVDYIITVTWEDLKNGHALELEKDGLQNGDRREVSPNMDLVATVASCMPSMEKLYLEVREE